VCVTQTITLASLNGPAATIILGAPDVVSGGLGAQAVRGVWMDAGVLIGFTISNGHTATAGNDYLDRAGGGIGAFGAQPVVSNCVIIGCSSSAYGGGASWGSMWDCRILSNDTGWGSGGVYDGAGGGSYGGLRVGCAIAGNVALLSGGGGFRRHAGRLPGA
jgi:hypothetical protein